MTMLYLLQAGGAGWTESKRLQSAAGEPLTDEQVADAEGVCQGLVPLGIRAIYASANEPAAQVARLVGKALAVRATVTDDLQEIDFGLWQGLLVGEIRKRYAKLYRQWRAGDMSAAPPGGETFEQALDRGWGAVRRIAKKHRGQNVLIVTRPLMAALLRCRLTGRAPQAVWDLVDWSTQYAGYDLDRVSLVEKA